MASSLNRREHDRARPKINTLLSQTILEEEDDDSDIAF